MSEGITLDEFKEQVKPLVEEASAIDRRLFELQNLFQKLAEQVRFDESDEDALEDFRDEVMERSHSFFHNPDVDLDDLVMGSVYIWEQSTC